MQICESYDVKRVYTVQQWASTSSEAACAIRNIPGIMLGSVHMGSQVPLMLASPNMEAKFLETIKLWLIIITIGS